MKKLVLVFAVLIGVTACSIIGFHPKIHNPIIAGKKTKETKARVLLGADRPERSCFDVIHYKLQVDFTAAVRDKKEDIVGQVTIKAIAVADFKKIQIDMAKHLKPLDIIRIDQQGKQCALKYYREEGALFLTMEKEIKQGEQFLIQITYSGCPPEAKRAPWRGGFVRKQDVNGNPWWGVACETEGASFWWPCKDVMNDEPDSVDVYYKVPLNLTAVGNGKLIDTTTSSDAREWHWKISYPINLYNVTFYIGQFKLLHDTYESPITKKTLDLNHYVLAYNYERAEKHFKQTQKYIQAYEEFFGPYAFYRDGFKLVESPYAGMEHQSAIAYGNGYRNDYFGSIDYIILHETAHEWWGNCVTANDLADGWIHEGLATYSEALYVEKIKGREAAINYLINQRMMIINRRPISYKKGIRYFNFRDSDIYVKGTWMMHSLRELIDDDKLFFDIIQTFYKTNSYQTVSSADFMALVNQKTGKDYTWFFQQYLFNRFTPVLNYEVKDGWLYFEWDAKYTNANFSMAVRLLGTDGKMTRRIAPKTNEVRKVQLMNNEAPVRIGDQYQLMKATQEKGLAKKYAKKNPSK
ncbi:MAG: M1 family metallopeptidase [Bacteroidia bacterium]